MDKQYIAGFFDADGYITIAKPKRKQEATPHMGITNNVKSLLEEIEKIIFRDLGIKGYISKKTAKKKNHHDGYDLKYVGFAKCIAVLNYLPINHPKKVKRSQMLPNILKLTPRNGKYIGTMLADRRQKCKEFIDIK